MIRDSLEHVQKCQKLVALALLVWRLATRGEPSGDRDSKQW